MADHTAIQWTDATSRHVKMAARKVGVSADEYVRLRAGGLKFCWRCRAWRALAVFSVDRSRYDALSATCIRCRRVSPKQLPLIRETNAEYERRRYATDPAYRAERRQRVHARKRGVAPLPYEAIEALTVAFLGRCAYCPEPATTWDHVLPVSAGGRTVPGNIVPACVSCNSRKGNRDLYDFIEANDVQITTVLESYIALGYEWGELS